jgi:hypothetical protein
VGGGALLGWLRRRRHHAKPIGVFLQLAAIGRLSPADQWLLLRIARQQALPGPATLLMSTRTLRVHGAAFVRHAAVVRKKQRLKRIAAIRRRLLRPA